MTTQCIYDRGVAALVAEDPDGAARWFAAVVETHPESVLAQAGLAAALAEVGDHDGMAAALASAQRRRRLARRDRHHAAVVTLLLTGSLARGTALALEHLDEFPDDAVVRHLLTRVAL